MTSPATSLDPAPGPNSDTELITLRSCLLRMSACVYGHLRSICVLQFFLKIASVVLFSWAIGALIGWLLSLEGTPAIGNTALIGFAISPVGLASALLLPSVYLGVVYFEQACILNVMADPSGRVLWAMLRALAKLPQLMQMASIQVGILLVVSLPIAMIAGATYWLLLADADINYYLTYQPPKFWLAIGIAVVLVIVATIIHIRLTLRWFLALPWLLTGQVRAVEALRLSAQDRSAQPIVWRSMLIWIVIRGLCSIVALLSMGCLTFLVFQLVGHDRATSVSVTTGLLLVHTVISASLTSIDQCWHVAGKWQAYLWTGAHQVDPSAGDMRVGISRARIAGFGLVVLITSLVLGLASFQQALSLSDQHDVKIVAHRAGAMFAPENSLAALRLAIEAGADAAEIDVQLSRDGTIFVVHDKDLKRLAGLPLVVSQATDAELHSVSIGWKPAPERPAEKLATLAEFLEAARDKIRLSIELKYYGWNERLAIQVIELLRTKEMLDQCEIISLEYKALEQVHKLEPRIPRGFLVSTSLGDITRLNVQTLSVSQTVFSDQLRQKARSRNMQVAVWTIDNPDTMFQLMVKGADQIVTNDPVAAAAMEKQYAELSDVELFLVRLRERLSP